MLRFSGTDVFLVGAASNIGMAIALRLLGEGAALCAIDGDVEALDELSWAGAVGPGRIVTQVADVADERSAAVAVGAAVTKLGGVDVLINVADVVRTPLFDASGERNRGNVVEIDRASTAIVCREVIRHLPAHSGVIVNVAASALTHGDSSRSACVVPGGGVLGFSSVLAAELASRGIRVVALAPGQAGTPVVPEEIARVVARAAAPGRARLTQPA